MESSSICQVVMATHSPILMAFPGAELIRITKYGLEPTQLHDTDHFRLLREFCSDPDSFVRAAIEG